MACLLFCWEDHVQRESGCVSTLIITQLLTHLTPPDHNLTSTSEPCFNPQSFEDVGTSQNVLISQCPHIAITNQGYVITLHVYNILICWASEIEPLIWCFQTFLNMEPQLLSQLLHSNQKASVFDCVCVCVCGSTWPLPVCVWLLFGGTLSNYISRPLRWNDSGFRSCCGSQLWFLIFGVMNCARTSPRYGSPFSLSLRVDSL